MKRTPTPKRRIESNGRIEARVGIVLGLALVALWYLSSRTGTPGVQSSDIGGNLGSGFVALFVTLGVIALNAAFVAAETAIELLRPHHAVHLRDEKPAQARALEALYKDKSRLAAACTFGNQVTRILMYLLGLAPAMGLSGHLPIGDWTTSLFVATALIWFPIFLINMVIGELVPKSYATLHPGRVCLSLNGFLQTFGFLFSGPASLVAQLANLLTARFGGKASFLGVSSSEEEIRNLVVSAEAEGEIEEDERDLLESVFEFGDRVAREVMTPRVDLDALPVSSPPSDVIALIEESGHSRIPLYRGTDDQIVGVIHAKDLLKAQRNGASISIRSLMREPLFVPENIGLRELLAEMRGKRAQLAVIQDELGGTSGIVTVEDIIEELVGEIRDEYDDEEEQIQRTEEGLLVDGRAPLDDVSEELGVELFSESFDTIGGYVFGLFGRQPSKGETIEDSGFRFTVAQTDGRRIHRLAIAEAGPDDTSTRS